MSDNKNVNNKEKGFVVGGYTFKTKQEAQEAKDEMNAIKYLSGKTDSKDPKQVYVLYNKIIDRQLFYTSIGLNYLKNLQQFLYNSPDIPDDKIKPIPVKSETQAAYSLNSGGKVQEQLYENYDYKCVSCYCVNCNVFYS